MIALQLSNGDYLTLSEETTILLKKRNELFYNEVFPSVYSLPFTIPIEGNQQHLSHQHLHEVLTSYITLTDVSLLLYGNVEHVGELQLKKSDDAHYVCEFYAVYFTDVKIATLFPGSVLGSEPSSDAGSVNVKTYPESRFCWPSYINDDDYFNSTYIHKYVNRHDASGFTLTSGSLLVPLGVALYLGYVLKQIANGIGYSAKGDLFKDQELMQIIVWNNYVFRWNGGNWEAREDLLVPDMTVNEFLIAVKNWIGLKITIIQKTREIWFEKLASFKNTAKRQDIDHVRDIDAPITFSSSKGMTLSISFTDSYNSGAIKSLENIDLTQEIDISSELVGAGYQPGDYIRCDADNAVYFINENGDHEFYSYLYQEVVTQDGDNTITTDGSPLTEFVDYPDLEEQLLPRIDHPISDKVVRNTFGLHLLFFRGMVPSARTGNPYPLATAHNLVPISIVPFHEREGEYSLYPNGDFGTYEKLWKLHDKWLSEGKTIETKLYWSYTDWKSFDERNLLVSKGQAYVWKELDISASIDGINYVKAKMVKA